MFDSMFVRVMLYLCVCLLVCLSRWLSDYLLINVFFARLRVCVFVRWCFCVCVCSLLLHLVVCVCRVGRLFVTFVCVCVFVCVFACLFVCLRACEVVY